LHHASVDTYHGTSKYQINIKASFIDTNITDEERIKLLAEGYATDRETHTTQMHTWAGSILDPTHMQTCFLGSGRDQCCLIQHENENFGNKGT
jgi:hypothetical protein